jgi:hypothetical protein
MLGMLRGCQHVLGYWNLMAANQGQKNKTTKSDGLVDQNWSDDRAALVEIVK